MQRVDPVAEARQKLFPPVQNRTLTEAIEALAAGQTDRARDIIGKYLQKHRKDLDALNLMAETERRANRLEGAEEFVAQCTAHPGYRFNYAVILAKLHKYEQALEQLDAYLITEPRNALYLDQKAKVLREMGRFDESLAIRRALVEEHPDSADFWLRYGDHSRGAGDKDVCLEAYRQALRLAPSQADAYLRLADLKTYRFSMEEIAAMEKQLAVAGMAADDRAHLHFALGKAYGDHKLYEKSFENYAKGNALRRLGMDVNPERLAMQRANCEALFSREFFEKRAGWGGDTRAPIFIVGLPRSGSTLLEQILSSHSAIEGLGELPFLDTLMLQRIAQSVGQEAELSSLSSSFDLKIQYLQAYPRVFGSMGAEDFRLMADRYLVLTSERRKPNCPRFIDKALSNFGHIGLIHVMYPHAKIVDVRRHPLDCGWSCFKNYFPGGIGFSYRLADIGRHYANYVGLMQHFDDVLPRRVHRVIYEELVANPETEIRRLFDHLELRFEENTLRFHENKRAVRTMSSEQVRLPLYKSGVAQWMPYESWLGPLKAALGPVLECYPQPPPRRSAV